MSFKLPRLKENDGITDTTTGKALRGFSRFWDSAMTAIEGKIEDITSSTSALTVILSGGTASIALDPTLEALAQLDSTTGFLVETAADTFAKRPLVAGSGISISNPAGVAGNPTIASTITQYTDEMAQDAVGGILTDTATIDFTYNDGANTIIADVKAGSIGPTQLADTAVTPGSYTNANITVGADGRLTAAVSGTAGIGSFGLVLLGRASPSGTGVVTFNSIPGGYSHLEVVVYGASDASATNADVNLTFNNDATANYDGLKWFGEGSATHAVPTQPANAIAMGAIPGATGPTNGGGCASARVAAYSNSALQKCATAQGALKISNSDIFSWANTGFWRSTAAITRIDLTLSAGNWVAGSLVCLYGMA